MKISIIIPTLNETDQIADCLKPLQSLRARGHEVIVVDGGSDDGTLDRICEQADLTMRSEPGRALQMNRGAKAASGDIFLFLHADTRLGTAVDTLLNELIQSDCAWGSFQVRLSGDRFIYRVIEFCMNVRSRLTGIATGDQTIFVTRQLFDESGGYSNIELMEDIELSRRLRKQYRPIFVNNRAITSSRRWETCGIVRTIFKMWSLRLLFALGAHPSALAKKYV